MKTRHKILSIGKEVTPILLMIGLIPLVTNDYFLTGLYVIVILLSFLIKREKNDLLVMVVGFVAMTLSESVFITTGVEVFQRNSLFGIMPLWLPFLWAYGFVVIKRSLLVVEA